MACQHLVHFSPIDRVLLSCPFVLVVVYLAKILSTWRRQMGHTYAGVLGMDAFHVAVLASTIALLPLLFIPSFKGLSWLSLVGCCSTVLVVITVAAVVALDPLRAHLPHQASPSPLSFAYSRPPALHSQDFTQYVVCLAS